MQKNVLDKIASFEFEAVPEKSPFWINHTKAWATVIEKTFPHIKGYIVADSQTINHESSFLPVYRINKPLKKSWLSIPFATISDPVIKNESDAASLLNVLKNHPLTQKSQIELRFNSLPKGISGFFSNSGYVNHQIVLDGNEDEIFRRFHKKSVQPRIKQSISSGLIMKDGTTMADVLVFYDIYAKMRKEQGLPPQPFSFFKNMWNELYPLGNIDLIMAQYEGKIVAASWALKNSWLYSFEYLARAGRIDKLRCAYFLNWNGIKKAINDGIKIVSFARTSARNSGLDQYKRGWGTEVIPYYDLSYPCAQDKFREDKIIYKTVRKISPLLPMPLFKALGEIIYRFI